MWQFENRPILKHRTEISKQWRAQDNPKGFDGAVEQVIYTKDQKSKWLWTSQQQH